MLVVIHQIDLNGLEWLKTALKAIVDHQALAAHNIESFLSQIFSRINDHICDSMIEINLSPNLAKFVK